MHHIQIIPIPGKFLDGREMTISIWYVYMYTRSAVYMYQLNYLTVLVLWVGVRFGEKPTSYDGPNRRQHTRSVRNVLNGNCYLKPSRSCCGDCSSFQCGCCCRCGSIKSV